DIDIPNVTVKRVMKIPGLGKAPIGPSKAKILYDFSMFIKVKWLLITNKYDAIHGVEEMGVTAWLLSKFFRVPYVFDMDSHITDQLRYSGFFKDGFILKTVERMETSAIKNASAVVTVCPYLTDIAKRYTDESKVHQIEDIPQQFPPPPAGASADKLRGELNIPQSAPVILYTGNFEKYQGIDLLIESIPEVVKSAPDAIFVIVGGDDTQAKTYSRIAENLGVARNVRFTGPRPLEWMPIFHEMADILLSPRIEGTNTPLKIYTYLKTGKPLVATDLPTHTQLLNRDIAMLAKPEKLEYSSAILLLLKDTALRGKIGLAGKEFVERGYNYTIFKDKIESVYKNLK
ncbi:MAG TPA: glycosyltransferase, partial [Nitrospirae bacterium]|nr:glycosyltransferase [Nitrospirota bacterium]